MRHRTSLTGALLLALLGAAQAQELGKESAASDAAGPADGWPDSPEGLLERFDGDGDARLDLGELGELYSLYFSASLSAEGASASGAEQAKALRQYAGRSLDTVVKEDPAILNGALIVDEEGMEVGRVTRLVVDREQGAYHAVIPAGKLVELIGFEFMVIPLSHLQIREDVLLLDDVDAVLPLEEERFVALEEAKA